MQIPCYHQPNKILHIIISSTNTTKFPLILKYYKKEVKVMRHFIALLYWAYDVTFGATY